MIIFPAHALERAHWRKSSHSAGAGNDCIEVADLTAGVGIRDSKDPCGPALALSRAGFAALVRTACNH